MINYVCELVAVYEIRNAKGHVQFARILYKENNHLIW